MQRSIARHSPGKAGSGQSPSPDHTASARAAEHIFPTRQRLWWSPPCEIWNRPVATSTYRPREHALQHKRARKHHVTTHFKNTTGVAPHRGANLPASSSSAAVGTTHLHQEPASKAAGSAKTLVTLKAAYRLTHMLHTRTRRAASTAATAAAAYDAMTTHLQSWHDVL